MAERPKLLYVIIHDEGSNEGGERRFPPPRYTRPVLQSTLQLMGCKPRHAFKISDRVFDIFRTEIAAKRPQLRRHHSEAQAFWHANDPGDILQQQNNLVSQQPGEGKEAEISRGCKGPKVNSKKRAAVTVTRERFLDVVCDALAGYQYVGPNQKADLMLACRFREKKASMTVLLCGTSGCGKSTLSSLLASRLGITTVVSTDSVRHMMRSFASEKENPLLWASTYHAGEYLDPVAVAEAKAKKKEAKMASIPLLRGPSLETRLNGLDNLPKHQSTECQGLRNPDASSKGKFGCVSESGNADGAEPIVGARTMAVQGFKAQSEMVIDSLDRLISAWELKNESVVIEGVHLSLNFVMGLMKKHPSIIPFMVYISNEGKHLERFAVRAKYMTLDPARNKYVKYIRNIRTIQEYLCKRADKHLVPKVNNTNVDKSIALIHATVFSCLRRREAGEALYDQGTNTVKVVDQEYRSQYAASSLGSKGMFQLIQRRGSSRHLMALMNNDGSVAKAWPIESIDSNGRPRSSNGGDSGIGTPVYGPLAIRKAEPVNLQFGNFGLSAWLTEKGAASHNGSGDGHSSRGEGDLNSSQPGSSCSSSPRHFDGAEKELTEEIAVSGSEEEPDEEEHKAGDTDGELSEAEHQHLDGEEDGSVDEESIRSDEDAEFLGTGSQQDDGFWAEDLEDAEGRLEEATMGMEGEDSEVGYSPSRREARLSNKPRQFSLPLFSKRLPFGNPGSLPICLPERRSSHDTTICLPPGPAESRSHSRSKSFPNWDYSLTLDRLKINTETGNQVQPAKVA